MVTVGLARRGLGRRADPLATLEEEVDRARVAAPTCCGPLALAAGPLNADHRWTRRLRASSLIAPKQTDRRGLFGPRRRPT